MSSTLAPPPVSITPPSADLLTPNTRTEAEAALQHNVSCQTSSAGRPQPTTPLPTSTPTSNYLAAAEAHGISTGIPHPPTSTSTIPVLRTEDGTASNESYDTYSRVWAPLSRGTTAAILQKMNSGDYNFGDSTSGLARRVSREGERRTSLVTVKSREGQADKKDAEPKQGLQRHQSWRQEDMKHSIMQQYMQVPEAPSSYGYSSRGGTPMYTG
jgi:hypothetical protein